MRMVSATVRWYPIFFAQNARAWLAWHVVSTTRCHLPHSLRNNGLNERRVRWIFYFTFRTDLTPLNYFLLGYVKAHVYTDKPASFDALEDNIEAFIREIPAEMSQGARQNCMDHLRRSRGQHLPEIIFKTVCCGVGGRALASYTECRGFEPQCGGRLSSLNLLATIRKY